MERFGEANKKSKSLVRLPGIDRSLPVGMKHQPRGVPEATNEILRARLVEGYSLHVPTQSGAPPMPTNQRRALITRRCAGYRKQMRGSILFWHAKNCRYTSIRCHCHAALVRHVVCETPLKVQIPHLHYCLFHVLRASHGRAGKTLAGPVGGSEALAVRHGEGGTMCSWTSRYVARCGKRARVRGSSSYRSTWGKSAAPALGR